MGILETYLSQEKKREAKVLSVRRQQEEELTKERAFRLGLPYVRLDLVPINLETLVIIPEEKARQAQLAIIQKIGEKLHIACFDPRLPETRAVLKELSSQGFIYNLLVASLSSLRRAWSLYKDYIPQKPSIEGVFFIESSDWAKLQGKLVDINTLAEEIIQHQEMTSELLSRLFIGAIIARATDIHTEPYMKEVLVRFRIDGVLQDIVRIPHQSYHLLLSRIKILSGLKLNIHNVNQDGRFSIKLKTKSGGKIDIRVSVIPSAEGETIVMRLLGVDIKKATLEELGLGKHQIEILKAEISKPNGMILTTGPTGSGKTTTLYACLKYILKPEINIITIENPVEYEIQGITQTQVNEEEGYTFEKGLAAIVRQDPDVIMVGEIRSSESADMAINAALTGHLVLSTLHTNDAAGAIPRLRNLGVNSSLIPPAVNAVIGQRLVRRLCPYCKVKYKPSEETIQAINQALSLVSPRAKVTPPEKIEYLYRPKGCPKCFGTGYHGRDGIFEIFPINDAMEKLILREATSYEFRKEAMEQGMLTMLQHGLLKVVSGETSLEEVRRIAGDAKYIKELYGEAVVSILSKSLQIPEQIQKKLQSLELSAKNIEEILLNSSLEDLIRWSMAAAYKMRATDIHYEPEKDSFVVRFRIDGVLHNIARLPKKFFPALVSEIKDLSSMKVGVYKKIQEGRFSVNFGEVSFDIRVSVIPGGWGETLALRLLEAGISKLKLSQLGIEKEMLDKIILDLKKPNGIILTTGPTGAGKTTTLYSMLNLLNDGEKKIITIENPIEYKLPGIIQTQVNPDQGYTFATALKSLLRQDPDIMMIGEIRDFETAKTAIQAAMTGHLILSTLHTNDALGSIARLENLGVSRDDLNASLQVIIAQRLVRRLCRRCRRKVALGPEKLKIFQRAFEQAPQKHKAKIALLKTSSEIYQPAGCPDCAYTGFKGRIGAFEIVRIDEDMKELIAQGASGPQLRQEAIKKGTLTMKQDALLKVLEGITSLSEVERVFGV